jgi:hypothetical protein
MSHTKEYQKKYRDEHKEACKRWSKKWYLKNKKEHNKKGKIWRENNKDKVRLYQKEYYLKNRVRCVEKNKRTYKTWIDKNRERKRVLTRLSYHKFIEKRRVGAMNSYYKNNERDRRKKRRKIDSLYKLRESCRSRVYCFLKNKRLTKKYHFSEYIGCNVKSLKIHIEKQFMRGMTWRNHGKWHIDHIIPLSSAKTEEAIYKLCHYTNLQPLWAKDNLIKGNKIL